jgi:hypothetical protein
MALASWAKVEPITSGLDGAHSTTHRPGAVEIMLNKQFYIYLKKLGEKDPTRTHDNTSGLNSIKVQSWVTELTFRWAYLPFPLMPRIPL